jgi:hypothetical protein
MNNQTNTKDLNRPVTMADMSLLFTENNKVLIPLMGKMMDEKIRANNNVLIPLMGKMMDEKIKANNVVLLEMVDEKIKANNIVLLEMVDEKIRTNNNILIRLIDQKIKANNEYIFSEFNNQTERILNLFRGVIRVKRDGTFSVSY